MSWRQLRGELRSDPDLKVEREILDAKHAIGRNVYRLRLELGMSQEKLAEAAGTAQPNISAIERGDANPTVETIGRVAAALETSVSALHDRSPSSEPREIRVQIPPLRSSRESRFDIPTIPGGPSNQLTAEVETEGVPAGRHGAKPAWARSAKGASGNAERLSESA